MAHFALPHAESQIDKELCLQSYQRRMRTLLLYSVASEKSSRSSFNLNVVPSVIPAVKLQHNNDAWGSFVSSTSATVSLRHLVSTPSKPPAQSEALSGSPRSRRASPLPSQNHISSTIHKHNPELHPMLARLEHGSKLCMQKTGCAACQKTGWDFPQCGKCKKMWCSRECRLVGGKRHTCN